MAKKKAAPAASGRPKTGRNDRKTIVVLKGSGEYAAWLQGASDRTRLPVSVIIDVAIAGWAKGAGLDEPPLRLGGR